MQLLEKFLSESERTWKNGILNFLDFMNRAKEILNQIYRERGEYGLSGTNKDSNPHSPYKIIAIFLFNKEQTYHALTLLEQRWNELAGLQSDEHLYRASIAMQLAEFYISLNNTNEALKWLWLTYADDVLHGTTEGRAEQLLIGRFGVEKEELEKVEAIGKQHRERGEWSATEGLAEGIIKNFIEDNPNTSVENYFTNMNVRKAVILTALPVEYAAVRKYLTNIQEITHRMGTIYEVGKFVSDNQTWQVAIAVIGAGNSGAAAEGERAITYFNPEVALFVGVAGGIKDVTLGDIVIGEKIYGYESGKETQNFQARPNIGNSSYDLVQRARAEARKNDWLHRINHNNKLDSVPQAFIGPIAAGEKVIASNRSSIWDFLRSSYSDALAVEMEGRGFLAATHRNQPISAIVVRGISDLVEGKEDADRAGWQTIAASHAAAFSFQMLSNLVNAN